MSVAKVALQSSQTWPLQKLHSRKNSSGSKDLVHTLHRSLSPPLPPVDEAVSVVANRSDDVGGEALVGLTKEDEEEDVVQTC